MAFDGKAKIVMATVGVGTFMSSFTGGAVMLILPLIETQFGASLSVVEWTVTSFLLIVSSLLLTFGRLADIYGQKRVYLTGFIVFTAGSLLCGLSQGIAMLIVCRVVQGIGAAMLFATGPAIITDSVAPENRGKALSVTAIAVALGLCAGPALGGIFSSALGWQSVFLINVPIGLVGSFLAYRNIDGARGETQASFDLVGSVIIFFALLFILLPLDVSGDYDIPPLIFASSIVVGLLLIAWFVFHERRCSAPLLEMGLFRDRVFAASNAAAVLAYLAQFMMMFLAPFYLEGLRGFSALWSGLLFLAMPLATMFVAPVSGSVSDRFDGRYASSSGMLIMAAGLLMASFFTSDTSIPYLAACMAVVGVGFGMFQTPNNSAIMGSVPPSHRGTAAGSLATMRNVGMVLGTAIAGALFSFFESAAVSSLSLQGLSGSALDGGAFVSALHATFLAAAAVAVLAACVSFAKGRKGV